LSPPQSYSARPTDQPPGCFLDRAAERLGDDLVTEADADERQVRVADVADQRLEGLDPGVVLVGAVARAG
jgi:hypothetical protein